VSPERFDPYAILRELDRAGVFFVVVGSLARVIQGSDEVARGLDLTPSLRPRNLEKLERALENLNARRVDGQPFDLGDLDPDREPVIALQSEVGEIKIVRQPAGTRGYEDLRHRATRTPLGDGLRPEVASTGDLVRMLEALGRDDDALRIAAMRRVVELDRGVEFRL
jgi:hypothetical protein